MLGRQVDVPVYSDPEDPVLTAFQGVEEAKRLLRAPSEARSSIEAIAKLSGFRSRSSFYTAFQAQVGMTPKLYSRVRRFQRARAGGR